MGLTIIQVVITKVGHDLRNVFIDVVRVSLELLATERKETGRCAVIREILQRNVVVELDLLGEMRDHE